MFVIQIITLVIQVIGFNFVTALKNCLKNEIASPYTTIKLNKTMPIIVLKPMNILRPFLIFFELRLTLSSVLHWIRPFI